MALDLTMSEELMHVPDEQEYTVRARRPTPQPAPPLQQAVPPVDLQATAEAAPLSSVGSAAEILKMAQQRLLSPYQSYIDMALSYLPDKEGYGQLYQDHETAGRALPTAGRGVMPEHLDPMARRRQWQALATPLQGGVPAAQTQSGALSTALNAYNAQGHAEIADEQKRQQEEAALRYKVSGELLGKQGDLIKNVLNAAKTGVAAQAANKFQFDYIPGVGYVRADPMTGGAEMLHRAFHGKDMAKLYEDVSESAKSFDFLGACNGDQACAAQMRRTWIEQELDKRIKQFGYNKPGATPQMLAAGASFDNPDVALQLLAALKTGRPIMVDGKDTSDEIRQQLVAAGYPVPTKARSTVQAAPAPVQPPLLDPTKEKQRTAEAEAIAKSSAEFSGLIDDRVSAAARNAELIRKLESLGDPFTNPFADYMTAAGGVLQQLGANGELIKMATTTGQVSQVVNDMVANMQMAQKGVQTDKDAERYARAQIDYKWNTPEGYRLNLRYLRAMNEYQLLQGQARDAYKGAHRDSTIGFSTHWAAQARKDPMSAYYVNPSVDREIKQQSIDMRAKGVLKNAKEQDRWINSQRKNRQQLIFRNEFISNYLAQFRGKTPADAEAVWQSVAKDQ